MPVLLDAAIAKIGQLHDGPDVPRMCHEIAAARPQDASYWAEGGNATSWCGIFQFWNLLKNGYTDFPPIPQNGVGPMWVNWWLDYGTPIPVGQEQLGDLALWLGDPPPHHISMVAGNGQYVGGNQSDGVTKAHYRTPDAIRRPPAAMGGVVIPDDPHPEIKLGATGAPVIELQRILGLPQTGAFDVGTDAAVRGYQADHGLDEDGEVGPLTWAALLGGAPAIPDPQPANVMTSKGSWYSQYDGKYQWRDSGDAPGSAALGVPDDAQGVAMPSRPVLGNWYAVRAPNGKVSIEQVTDLGPATWTGRTIDIAAAAAERFGYSPSNFPTDSIFTFWPVPVPREVAGLSKQNQAIQYRDIRKGLPPTVPTPPVVPRPVPIPIPTPIPQPQPQPFPRETETMDDKLRVLLTTEIMKPQPDRRWLQLQLLDSPAVSVPQPAQPVPPGNQPVPVPVPTVPIALPAPPAAAPSSNIIQNLLYGLAASLGAVTLGGTGTIGMPIGPDQTMAGTLSTVIPIITGLVGANVPIVNMILGLFKPKP